MPTSPHKIKYVKNWLFHYQTIFNINDVQLHKLNTLQYLYQLTKVYITLISTDLKHITKIQKTRKKTKKFYKPIIM